MQQHLVNNIGQSDPKVILINIANHEWSSTPKAENMSPIFQASKMHGPPWAKWPDDLAMLVHAVVCFH